MPLSTMSFLTAPRDENARPLLSPGPMTFTSSATNVVDLFSATLCGLVWPATVTGTVFYPFISYDGTTTSMTQMYTSTGGAYTLTSAANTYMVLNPSDFAGVEALQLISTGGSTTGTVVTPIARQL